MKKSIQFSKPMMHPALKTWQSNLFITIGDSTISFSGDDGNNQKDNHTSLRHYLMITKKDKDVTKELGFNPNGTTFEDFIRAIKVVENLHKKDSSSSEICRECNGKMKESTLIANYHNVQDKNPEFETNHEKCMKCTECGHSYTLGVKVKTQRELAIAWWNSLDVKSSEKVVETICNSDLRLKQFLSNRSMTSFTGREIEILWKENNKSEQQINFDMLETTVSIILKESFFTEDVKDNFRLFFEKLAVSQSFAVKSHKTLKLWKN